MQCNQAYLLRGGEGYLFFVKDVARYQLGKQLFIQMLSTRAEGPFTSYSTLDEHPTRRSWKHSEVCDADRRLSMQSTVLKII
jgi:hypothetical protein